MFINQKYPKETSVSRAQFCALESIEIDTKSLITQKQYLEQVRKIVRSRWVDVQDWLVSLKRTSSSDKGAA